MLTSLSVTVSPGLLVMVSSELVVLLIVCVGINIGSTQQQQGRLTVYNTIQVDYDYTSFVQFIVKVDHLQIEHANMVIVTQKTV